MTQKEFKFLQIINSIPKREFMTSQNLQPIFLELLELDYQKAIDGFEFVAKLNDNNFSNNKQLLEFFGSTMPSLFYKNNQQKTIKLLLENENIAKIVFLSNPYATVSISRELLLYQIENNKFDYAKIFMHLLSKNEYINFASYMKELIEHFIDKAIISNIDPNKRVVLNKKLIVFFNDFIQKLKATDKSLLLQRIKEVS